MFDPALMLDNLLTPPVLFFLLGLTASLLRSELEVPRPVARFLSLYLLFAIGLHGGHELASQALPRSAWLALAVATLLSAVAPLWLFAVLRLRLDVDNAAALAAAYGSVSAVTFITACSFLDGQGVAYGGYMVAALALMESPAIVVGVLLARLTAARAAGEAGGVAAAAAAASATSAAGWGKLAREAFLNGAVLLLLGSLAIGAVTGETGWKKLAPFAQAPFQGVLCFFLLDMGLVTARRLRDLRQSGPFLLGFGLLTPLAHAALAIAVARLLGLSEGDALLLTVLAGSASYIAVPAAIGLALPKANPSLYVPLALAVTFPFNVAIGIPLYLTAVRWVWS